MIECLIKINKSVFNINSYNDQTFDKLSKYKIPDLFSSDPSFRYLNPNNAVQITL